jgi:putative 4-mercaptohistidine N1-methyltranferase
MKTHYYETDSIVAEYLFFHFGNSSDYFPYRTGPQDALEFPVRVVQKGIKGVALPSHSRALDIGCAVGRSSFELTRFCHEVVAIDYSEPFIKAAQKIQKERRIQIEVVTEVGKSKTVSLDLPVAIHPEKVKFQQGDALSLPSSLGEFDLILAANLIDRLKDPALFLQKIPTYLKKGGVLILSSPYTWMESFTPREKWINASKGNFDALRDILESRFDLSKKEDLPMFIREHQRKYQWTVSEMSVWTKK